MKILDELLTQITAIQPIVNLLLVILTGVYVCLTYGLWKNQITVRRAECILLLESKYDEICTARMNNPAIMRCAQNCLHKAYTDMSNDERSYYHYCEMVLGFIEMSVFLHKVDRTLSQKMFDTFVAPMIRLELAYNAPMLEKIANAIGLSEESKALMENYKGAVE